MKILRVVATAMIFAGLVAPASADDVLDAARKERARREALRQQREKEGVGSTRDELADPDAPRPGRVLDNSSLKKRAGKISVGSGSKASDSGTTSSGSKETADTGGAPSSKEAAFWEEKMQAARNAVTAARTDVADLNQKINELRRASSAIDDPNLRQQKSQELRQAESDMTAKQAAVQAAEKGVQAVREEGRKARVPAGWVR